MRHLRALRAERRKEAFLPGALPIFPGYGLTFQDAIEQAPFFVQEQGVLPGNPGKALFDQAWQNDHVEGNPRACMRSDNSTPPGSVIFQGIVTSHEPHRSEASSSFST